MTEDARLAEIEARAEKATERYAGLRQSFDEALRGKEQERAFKNLDAFLYDNQRDLMASISTDVPYLLSLIRASSAREQALREALEVFAEAAAGYEDPYDHHNYPDDFKIAPGLRVEHLRKARAALQETK